MEDFCYWHEDAPFPIPSYQKKICLLREMEFRIEKEAAEKGLVSKINIFCPYANAEQANECMDYKVMKYGKISK